MNVRHAYIFEHKHTRKAQESCTDSFKRCLDFDPPDPPSSVLRHTQMQEHGPPPAPLSRLASVCQSGVRGVSLQSVLSCCFVESGGLWGVSTGDRCGQISSRRRCTGMASLRSGSAGVGTARRTGRTWREGENQGCNQSASLHSIII